MKTRDFGTGRCNSYYQYLVLSSLALDLLGDAMVEAWMSDEVLSAYP
jgi:hypothetical protein